MRAFNHQIAFRTVQLIIVVAIQLLVVQAAISAPALLPIGERPRFPSRIAAISADGSTLIGRQSDATFLWDRANGLRFLDELPGDDVPDASAFRASAISGDGRKIVGTLDGAPVLWQRGVGTTTLPLLPNGTNGGAALGISDDGDKIVGWAHNGDFLTQNEPGVPRFTDLPLDVPVMWDESGTIQVLEPTLGQAVDVTNDGVVVGKRYVADPAIIVTSGFRWDASRGIQQIPGFLPESVEPLATLTIDAVAVSSDGTRIAGNVYNVAAQNFFGTASDLGYRWSGDPGTGSALPANGLTEINPPLADWTGFVELAVSDLSSDGSTIVGRYRLDSSSLGRAFVWTEQSGLQDLTLLLQSLGVDMDDLVLAEAPSVSADGKTIAAAAYVPLSSTSPLRILTGFVAVIPEPSSALLIGFGLVALSRLGDRSPRRHPTRRTPSRVADSHESPTFTSD